MNANGPFQLSTAKALQFVKFRKDLAISHAESAWLVRSAEWNLYIVGVLNFRSSVEETMARLRTGQLVLVCPITGRDYPLRLELDEDSFKALPDMPLNAKCPHCQEEHRWRPNEAKLLDAPALRPALS